MAAVAEPSLEELLWTVAAARLILGPKMSIQAPPNLTPDAEDVVSNTSGRNDESIAIGWRQLVAAGINDWGGISPITRDYVNPERPWPHLSALAAVTADVGKVLLPRLPVYPQYLEGRAQKAAHWIDGAAGVASPLAGALRQADVHGLARATSWFAGAADKVVVPVESTNTAVGNEGMAAKPVISGELFETTELYTGGKRGRPASSPRPQRRAWRVAIGTNGLLEGTDGPAPSEAIGDILKSALGRDDHVELSEGQIVALFGARGKDFEAVVAAANTLRRRVNGDTVTYVVNRNINYTNVCTFGCRFCAFSKG